MFKFKKTVLSKYLNSQILRMFAAIFTVLCLIVFGNRFANVIKQSTNYDIDAVDLVALIGVNMLKDLSLIISISLFLAIILALTILNKNSEILVIRTSGISDFGLFRLIRPLVIWAVSIVLILSSFVAPWAISMRDAIITANQNKSEFSIIKSGEFQEFQDGKMIFYAKKSKLNGSLEDIFIWTKIDDEPIITLADKVQKYTDPESKNIYLRLKKGLRYYGFWGDTNKRILSFENYDIQIAAGNSQRQVTDLADKKGTLALLLADDLTDAANGQWRLSQPLSVFILSIFAVFFAKFSGSRDSKNYGIFLGIGLFFIYHNLLLFAQSLVERGTVHPVLGLWWVHILLLLVVYFWSFHANKKITPLLAKIKSQLPFNKENYA